MSKYFTKLKNHFGMNTYLGFNWLLALCYVGMGIAVYGLIALNTN